MAEKNFEKPNLELKREIKKVKDGSPQAVIVSAVRTAIGKFGGALADIPATQLGAIAIKEAVRRAGIKPEDVEEAIVGNVVSAGLGQNPARQAALGGGLPSDVAALLVNKVCASSLKAVALAAQAIKAGDADIIVAGGMESMSRAPYLLDKARNGYRMGNGQLLDSMVLDGLWCAFHNFHMGNTGELVAEKFGVTRKDQDEYAYNSHLKAVKAIKEGKFKEEIVPVTIPQKKGEPIIFDTDESPRADTSLEALAKLKPAFKADGTVTAGNAPGVNDAGAALVVMSEDKAKALGIKPIAKILGYYTGGLNPEWVMMTPVVSVKGLLARLDMKLSDFDLIELNEAFSLQALAVGRELGFDWDKVNVNGGAVALGHPIGASGARILVTLLYALKQRNKKLGLAALCLGGGNGVALAVEMV